MSEEKMKLCLITTIINNPEIQKLHGQQLHVTEGQLLELKFRADSKSKVKTDKNGFIIRDEKETQKETAMESETPKDREVEPGGYLTEETTKEKAVNNVVEENTQSNVSKKDYLYGLSSEAAAQIKTLKFNKNSKLIWPVEGSIIMPYDVKNTVYYATLDEYKTNPGIVIQSSKGTAIKAAADGVITKITQDDELGVVISQAVGNDYIVNYGQTINPEVKEGSFVEAGQTIAYVNQPTKYYSKEGDNIYFSVERNGKTKDPLNYIDYED